MPAAAEVPSVGFVLRDNDDLRVAIHGFHIIMHVQRAEASAKSDVLLWGHPLVAEEDDTVLEQRLVDQAGRAIVDIAAEIDPLDHCAKRPADRPDSDILGKRHWTVLLC